MTRSFEQEGALKRTTISVYQDDADWLRGLQREIQYRRDTYITLHDLIHEIILNAKNDETEQKRAADG